MELSGIVRALKRSIKGQLQALQKPSQDKNPGELWIDKPNALQINERSKVSDEVRRHCRNLIVDGVTKVENSVSADICDKAVEEYKKFALNLDTSGGVTAGRSYPRIVNLHGSIDTFKQLFTRNRSLESIDYCFGEPATVYTSLTFQVGTQQPIHRDVPVFRTSPNGRYFGMWVALEDADENNGPLMAIKGGHATALLDPYSFAEKHCPNLKSMTNEDLQKTLWDPYQDTVHEMCLKEGLIVERITAKKGDTVLWHSMLPHGGSPILQAGRTRYSCVFHIVPGKSPVYQADVFFQKHVPAPYRWDRGYEEYESRVFLANPPPSFMA